MELIVFDLDGTLLNESSELSAYTVETLNLLREQGIAHTVATGRTMLSARRVIGDHGFELPHIYSNGVTMWDPRNNALKVDNQLDNKEVTYTVECALKHGLAPFINTVLLDNLTHYHAIFHGNLAHSIERDLLDNFFCKADVEILPLAALTPEYHVTNISMIGETQAIQRVHQEIGLADSLMAYSGYTMEGKAFSWIDIHHKKANKGSAVDYLKTQLGASNVICFGDSDNDLSMFALSDECYAPANANDRIKSAASAVIGHHHEEGVARFLRERFSL
ncbi:HAD-IIB family hydrolase [Alteromonas sediminis]|uniref:HAD-IIB family hydrolase n=1 Tax=Alteromonas sediminis TaxID=2259342 RepID=A0A3N5Y4A7_9ALTE|nr:HAD-IIB family hydrolase [Alteromonas sediminis]RPJ64909.1 HAD-IIB family hydrolase [Alteromonas sediminis]